MPSEWGPDGKVYDRIMGTLAAAISNWPAKQQTYEGGYRILPNGPGAIAGNGKIVIDGVAEQSLQVTGMTVYLQNAGMATVYMDSQAGVNADKWEIVPGRIAGPFMATDKLYFRGAGATTLKYLFVTGAG